MVIIQLTINHQGSKTTSRIMSLKNPNEKMSKSDPNENSRIMLTDSAEQIQSKIKKATMDSIKGISYDPKERPGYGSTDYLELLI